MGNFCEQYGILPIAPSQRKHNKHRIEKYQKRSFWKKRKSFEPNEYYNKSKKFAKKPNKHYKKYDNKKFDKMKIKIFKCKKDAHFANGCKVKQKINQLQINDKEKEDLYKILELRNTDSENDISPDKIESSSSDEYSNSSSSPNINLGCNDNCCKSINVLTKSLNVLTKQEEQEELLLEAISKINDPELKTNMLHKLRKMLNKEKTNDVKAPKPTISLSETLERFNKLKPKKVNLKDLQFEVNQIKNETQHLYMCVYIYVCIYIKLYLCIYIHTYIYMYIHIYIYTCICITIQNSVLVSII